jgi:hypothetical protein
MQLYIDPGTGGMLFTILFGLLGGLFYFLGTFFVKIKYSIGGGRNKAGNEKKVPLVVFSDHKRYGNTFGPILDELEKRGIETRFLTMSEDDPLLTKEYKHITCEFIGTGNVAFSKLNLLNAEVVLSTTPGLDVLMWKRSKNVNYYVHIPHATTDITLYRMFGIDFYDGLLLPGEYHIDQVRKLEELREIPEKELVVVGTPYMDVMRERLLEAEKASDAKSEIVSADNSIADESKATSADKKTVLVAPSWGDSSILKKFGDEFIDALVKTGYDIVIRPHPQSFTAEKEFMEGLMAKYGEGSGVTWNRDNDNFDILRKADIMISDFSGVVCDYTLVFDKPIIYADTSFDASVYDQAWLDEELWILKTLPKLGVRLSPDQFDHVKDVIDSCINDETFKAGREQARKETWFYIGESVKRTVDHLENKIAEIEKETAA